jgi:acyl carrier protein
MTRDEIFVELRRLMAEMFDLDPEKITATSRLGDDLDMDSIDAIDLVIKLQDMTSQKVDQEEMKAIRTVGDIVDLVARRLLHET